MRERRKKIGPIARLIEAILDCALIPAAGIICLVDDDLSMLKALNRLLLSVGLQARLFSEPLRFLAYVICNTVALAVIDIFMSGMSGLEVQKELQVVPPKTRIIISTANDHDSVRNAAMRAGAIAYFVKPFDDDAFLAAVYQAMASES
jgi:FixJ family two-component response regulator